MKCAKPSRLPPTRHARSRLPYKLLQPNADTFSLGRTGGKAERVLVLVGDVAGVIADAEKRDRDYLARSVSLDLPDKQLEGVTIGRAPNQMNGMLEDPLLGTDGSSGSDIYSRKKQRGNPVSLGIVGLASTDAKRQRQNRFCAIQRLYLARFIHAQHNGAFPRVEV